MEKLAAAGRGLRRIAIVGPESTGKSSLAGQLAAHHGEPWVAEYARAYLEGLGRPYQQEDLKAIAQGQLALEAQAEASARRFLFCDTNLLVIQIWSEFVYGSCDPWILAHRGLERYALHLLTDIDLPWEPDPLREHPHRREELFALYHQALEASGCPYAIVRGQQGARLEAALKALGGLTS
jgi:NadR type nicotinamide-nucleotide adenylyltransferase